MSHRIGTKDRTATSYEPAWHNLGKVFDKHMTATEVLSETSVGDYQVEQTIGFIAYDPKTGRPWIPPTIATKYDSNEDDDEAATEANQTVLQPPAHFQWMATKAFFNIRNDIKCPDFNSLLSPAGVGEGYTVVQNNELIQIADKIIDETGAKFVSAGTLRNGKLVYLVAEMPDIMSVAGDQVKKYILIYSSHDGSRAITVKATSIRVVCWNTLSAALANMANTIELRHTANVQEAIEEAIKAVKLSRESFEKQKELFNSMAKRAVNSRFVDAFLKAVFPDPKEKEGVKRNNKQSEKKRNRIKELLEGGQAGANGPGMKIDGEYTEWALYNAISEYSQYDATRRTREGKNKEEEAFINNALGGTQENTRTLVMETLSRRDELMQSVDMALVAN